jgi:hypothetical protein
MSKAKTDFPDLKEAVVQVDAGVEYRQIVEMIEALKKQMPKVYLGG